MQILISTPFLYAKMFGGNKKIIIKLQGGLGNQMFQYAVARSLINEDSKVYFDHQFLNNNSSHTPDFTARKYELQIFSQIKSTRVIPFNLNYLRSDSFPYKNLRNVFKPRIRLIRQENNEYIAVGNSDDSNYTYLEGYFQSEKYFNKIRTVLLREFSFPDSDSANSSIRYRMENSANAVSIHFRRGDYLKAQTITEVHGILPISHYEKALDILESKYGFLSLFIFSDDIAWAKQNFNRQGAEVEFIDINQFSESWKDMALMKECKHHIIANSSYSWWGAWLSTKNGEVFAPANWFNPEKVRFRIEDFIPSRWHIVSND